MLFKKSVMTAAVFAVGSLAVMSANAAGTESSSFNANVKVETVCTLNAAPLVITLDDTAAAQTSTAVKGSTNIILNCSKGTVATVGLTPRSTGLKNGEGNLKGGVLAGETIAYKLSSDEAGVNAWGADTAAFTTAPAPNYTTPVTTPIHLTMIGGTDVTAGNYTDIIDVSIAY